MSGPDKAQFLRWIDWVEDAVEEDVFLDRSGTTLLTWLRLQADQEPNNSGAKIAKKARD